MAKELTCFDCKHCQEDGFDYDYAGRTGFSGSGEFYCKLNNRGIADGWGNGNSNPCARFTQKEKKKPLRGRPFGAGINDNDYEEVS